jgi:hypothetical protein
VRSWPNVGPADMVAAATIESRIVRRIAVSPL